MFVPIIMGKRGITDLKHYITIKKTSKHRNYSQYCFVSRKDRCLEMLFSGHQNVEFLTE